RTAQLGPWVALSSRRRRQQRAFLRELLAIPPDRLQGTLGTRIDQRHRIRRLADYLRGARAVLHEGGLGDRRLRRSWSVRSAAVASVSAAAAAQQVRRRAAGESGWRARPSRSGRTYGDPLSAARWPLALHGVRSLCVLRLRVRREVVVARDGDPQSDRDRPLRNTRRLHGRACRDEGERSRDGRRLLGQEWERAPAAGTRGGPRREWCRNGAAASLLGVPRVSARPRELER